jgi:glycosyltransferase involved in cell wall biosynthesis
MKNKLVTRVHTPTVFGDRYNGATSVMLSRLAGWPEKIQTLRSRAVSAASDRLILAVADEWKVPPSRMTRLPNGIRVDWTRALAAEQPREIEGEYLLYFGRLERRKGVHVLTEALGDVLVRHPSLTAVFVGKDWGLRSDVVRSTAYATGRVKLLDTIARPRLFGVIRHARLVVLPSLFENVSNAALESMALGRPVIGTRGTAFEELIEDGVTGWLTEPGDPGALARTINACLARSDLEQIGARALASVRQYDGLEVGRQQVAFLRQAAFGGARPPAGKA